jgi:hypothetical protein
MTYYKFKDKKITQFLTNTLLIKLELEKIGIVLLPAEFFDIDEFIEQTKDQYGFLGHDEFK